MAVVTNDVVHDVRTLRLLQAFLKTEGWEARQVVVVVAEAAASGKLFDEEIFWGCQWDTKNPPSQESTDPSVAIVAMLEGQTLNRVPKASLFLAGRRLLPMPIIAGSADASELAHALDSDLALGPRRRHRLDDFVDAVPPGTPLRRR
jgi:hypothetical protein